MNIQRILKHQFFLDWQVGRAFPSACLTAIEAAIHSSERTHVGELRFVVEASLEGAPLWRGQTVCERAIDVFSQLRVWDTESNNGVLIYVLLAERAVEIIADRGIHAHTGSAPWRDICHDMEVAFAKSEFQSGTLAGIASIATLIRQHFPAPNTQVNELPDAPIVLT